MRHEMEVEVHSFWNESPEMQERDGYAMRLWVVQGLVDASSMYDRRGVVFLREVVALLELGDISKYYTLRQ
jgi:hypothetical protein